ncbi:MAG TPA: GNAT family N-acetyltransferase [Puia sp.]|nr:GNAT family N-acetyltransferase [Puia sp.]
MQEEKLFIRLADQKDAELIAEMSRQTFYDTFASVNTKENMDKFLREQFTKEKLMAEAGAPGNFFLLAYLNQEPQGYLHLKKSVNPEELQNLAAIEIGRIYAVQKAIGRGVGSSLMQAAIDFAQIKNEEVIWLGVWEHNQKAIKFYLKWGFEKFGEHLFMLGDDPQTDWLMKKNLR